MAIKLEIIFFLAMIVGYYSMLHAINALRVRQERVITQQISPPQVVIVCCERVH